MGEHLFGMDTGLLGYGNMRLPRIEGRLDYATIDKMIDTFLAAGFKYFDTCYTYEAAEQALGDRLVKRYPRHQYQINTKLTLLWSPKIEDMQRMFEESLRRLSTDYIDFYFLHALNATTMVQAEEWGAWDFIKRLKDKGQVKHIGFSMHDSPEVLDTILTRHPETELVLLQINYLDWDDPKTRSRELYETARRHNVPISVMEPCKGGWLASEASEAGKLLKAANPDVSAASLAFRFVAELEGIHSILSGMGSLFEVEDNIKTLRDPEPLSAEEHKLIKQAVEIINANPRIPCTDCLYCLPHCPKKIYIPEALKIYNNHMIHDDLGSLRHLNFILGVVGSEPKECTMCGACEKVCPQKIEISGYMEKMRALL